MATKRKSWTEGFVHSLAPGFFKYCFVNLVEFCKFLSDLIEMTNASHGRIFGTIELSRLTHLFFNPTVRSVVR